MLSASSGLILCVAGCAVVGVVLIGGGVGVAVILGTVCIVVLSCVIGVGVNVIVCKVCKGGVFGQCFGRDVRFNRDGDNLLR